MIVINTPKSVLRRFPALKRQARRGTTATPRDVKSLKRQWNDILYSLSDPLGISFDDNTAAQLSVLYRDLEDAGVVFWRHSWQVEKWAIRDAVSFEASIMPP